MAAGLRIALVFAALSLVGTGTAQAFQDGDRRGYDHRHERDDRNERRWRGDRDGRSNRYGPSITVYEHADFQGRTQTFSRGIRDMRSAGMNDMISSVEVRGAWEVCEHADFRGRCEIINRDVRNFERMRMNDQISSLRPVESRRGGW
ncbi:beta/gamma crystallin family protein [Luteimonas sp. S4-F44]|uniref:beta/gamma crystallin-related protein n=1 Tax=Luteimonas sp. S4-F44 TaxID=2925842 RepID=UPI001F5303DB|nr:beta/gamma crystallin-related protein [Luteimonas sp. S4-F44]UNK41844.1 beta/gamma crystallin family protein [Luteimonas sp. S4-F44]